MKKTNYIVMFVVLFSGLASLAQEKKWTLRECVEHALKNNITIQQTELDAQLATIDKKDAFGNCHKMRG